ncbi:MAG TPA: hypothetical protein VGC13_04645 [Longimicrobium sp.]|jgi:hypothetical protein|uniref:hypothetical protein n=1 Tax=Longimicrobium sp. TaxID=2029185 RepID=UPI002ED8D507
MAFRTFRDPEGREWQVWDVIPSREVEAGSRRSNYLPAEMADGWLCFEAADQKRRLTPFPSDWATHDDAAIHALCCAAEPVAARRTASIGE